MHDRSLEYMKQMAISQGLSGLGSTLYNAATRTTTIANSSTTLQTKQLAGSILAPAAGSFLQGAAQQYAKYWANKAKGAVKTVEIPGGLHVNFYVVESFKLLMPSLWGAGGGIYGKNGMY